MKWRTPLFSIITVGHTPELGPNHLQCYTYDKSDTFDILFPEFVL